MRPTAGERDEKSWVASQGRTSSISSIPSIRKSEKNAVVIV